MWLFERCTSDVWGMAEAFLGLGLYFIVCAFSKVAKTSTMEGRFLWSDSKHLRISWAMWNAALMEYWSSIFWSIIFFSLFLSSRDDMLHCTKFCLSTGWLVSRAALPVSISSRTTPNPYTSLLTYRCPAIFQIHIFFHQ